MPDAGHNLTQRSLLKHYEVLQLLLPFFTNAYDSLDSIDFRKRIDMSLQVYAVLISASESI